MLAHISATLFRAFMLKAWSLSLSVAVWVLGRANKAKLPLPPVLDHLLLSEEEIEQRIGDFLQLIEIAAAGDDVSMLGSGEFPFQRQIHDDDEVTAEGDVEDFVPTVLTFYVSSEMPDTLALVQVLRQRTRKVASCSSARTTTARLPMSWSALNQMSMTA